jgi:acyl-homoserine-lactone acylase
MPAKFHFYTMLRFYLCIITIISSTGVWGQSAINPATIDIVRDSFGVPHVFAPTDAAAAYGLAWAHAEDDFKTIQECFLAGKKMLGRHSGKKGATIDYIVHLIKAEELVEAQYDSAISPAFKKLLQGYCDGFNAYAASHPGEVLVKKMFPITPKNMLTYSMLQLFVSCRGDEALQKVFKGVAPTVDFLRMGGSNAFAFNSHKTANGNSFLNINAHQPLNGPVSWYEAHVQSEEGWNILGALFTGSPVILLGCNEYLGWGHTVNAPDKTDVFQLEINPENKLQYRFNGNWETLQEETVKLKVKVAGIPISVKRKVYTSKYGPTVIAPNGTFSIRSTGMFSIAALEQWYHMNKARNYTEFYKALKMEAIPGYNVVYADRYDTIFYLSNGKMPLRQPGYNWRSTVPGNTSSTLWTAFHPLEELPQVLNPPSGYLFNSNHSPFNATAPADNIKSNNYDATMGYETNENNRSTRFMQQIAPLEKVSYEDFKRIKYDRQFPSPLVFNIKSEGLFTLDEAAWPDVATIITSLKQWDRKAGAESKGAAYFGIAFYYIVARLQKDWSGAKELSTEQCVEVVRHIKAHCIKYFGSIDITLGDYQKLVRGDKAIPLPGLPDVIASMESEPYKKGMIKGRQGDSYIELVQFTKDGPQIESINCYGASNKPGNKHYDDQMELFTAQQTKKMSLKKEDVYKSAERIYHPQ